MENSVKDSKHLAEIQAETDLIDKAILCLTARRRELMRQTIGINLEREFKNRREPGKEK